LVNIQDKSTLSQDPKELECTANQRLTKICTPSLHTFNDRGSAQHELAKYLTGLLQPVLDIYSSNCIKDSSPLLNEIQQLDTDPLNSFL